MGNALIDIGAADELQFQRKILRTARMLKKLKEYEIWPIFCNRP